MNKDMKLGGGGGKESNFCLLRMVVDSLAACATEHVRPNQLLAKVCYLHCIFVAQVMC